MKKILNSLFVCVLAIAPLWAQNDPGPLTNTELRATPVPVSGTVTASGPLTDTQLRATPVPVSGTVTASGPLTDTQLRASAVVVDNSAVTQPISGTITANAGSGTFTISGTVTANAGTGTLTVDGSGVTQPVSGTVTASNATGNVASGAADSGNPVKVGAVARSTVPADVDNGDRVDLSTDLKGRLLTTGMCPLELHDQEDTQITNSTAETAIVTAVAAERHHITCFVASNATATAVTLTIKDSTAGSTQGIFNLAANGGIVICPGDSVAFKQKAAVNNNWTATLSALSITVDFFVHFCKE